MMTAINNTDFNYSIVDESLAQIALNNCKLFIEIDGFEISYAVLSNKNNRFLVFKNFTLENIEILNQFLFTDDILKFKDFTHTVFSVVNSKSTLVPNAFYDDEKKNELLLFNHTVAANESIAKDDFRFFDAKNIFAIDDDLLHFIEKNFNNAAIHHCSTPLIESLLLRNKNRTQPFINANIHCNQFELTYIENNQLQFYNALPCPTAEDFIYYILFMYEQFQLNPETVALELSGKVHRFDAFHKIAENHIKKVSFAGRPANFEFSYGFENLPLHYHLPLFNLTLCV